MPCDNPENDTFMEKKDRRSSCTARSGLSLSMRAFGGDNVSALLARIAECGLQSPGFQALSE